MTTRKIIQVSAASATGFAMLTLMTVVMAVSGALA